MASYREAIRLNPKYVTAIVNLGVLYGSQKKSAEAIACAREAIQLDPNFAKAHALLGLSLQQTGDLYGARIAITEAVRLDPQQLKPLLTKLPPIPVAPEPRTKRM
jgi:Flp pilus assembly protein TadD